MSHLRVTAYLASPLADDAPRLDAILEYLMSLHHGAGEPGYKVDRNFPAPQQGETPIPLLRRRLGPWLVGACSDPIYPTAAVEYVDHYSRRIDPDLAGLLAPSAARVIATSNSWTKSYRLPLRLRLIDRVVWFAEAYRQELLKALRKCTSLGKKRALGYGRVERWEAVEVERDYSWYAPVDEPGRHGTLLLATLPWGEWLPSDLFGYRRGYGGATPPYWHPDRYTELVVPC